MVPRSDLSGEHHPVFQGERGLEWHSLPVAGNKNPTDQSKPSISSPTSEYSRLPHEKPKKAVFCKEMVIFVPSGPVIALTEIPQAMIRTFSSPKYLH
jgi:hypothetical protein